jgi:hypothetical protein
MRRRDFIVGAAIATGAAGRAWSKPDQAKLDRLAVMTLSFNSVLKNPAHPDDPARTLDILDAPQMIADRFGIHHVEFQHSHFASLEPVYFKEVRDRLKKAGSRMNQICLEFESRRHVAGFGRGYQGGGNPCQPRYRQLPGRYGPGCRVTGALSAFIGKQSRPLRAGAIQRGGCGQDLERGGIQRIVFN